MARQVGIIKLIGSLGGLSFYKRNGVLLVRSRGGASKEQILNSPSFKRTRENMVEFGAASRIGKVFRLGFGMFITKVSATYLSSRITALFRKINLVGAGIRGQRDFTFSLHRSVFDDFEFNLSCLFSSVFFVSDFQFVTQGTSMVTWIIPSFHTDTSIKAPLGATHFKLFLACTILSDCVFDTEMQCYKPIVTELHGVHTASFSDFIALNGVVAPVFLSADFGFDVSFSNNVTVFNAVGILFYQFVNGDFYELKGGNAMKIVGSFLGNDFL